jgi:hypothetical protein
MFRSHTTEQWMSERSNAAESTPLARQHAVTLQMSSKSLQRILHDDSRFRPCKSHVTHTLKERDKISPLKFFIQTLWGKKMKGVWMFCSCQIGPNSTCLVTQTNRISGTRMITIHEEEPLHNNKVCCLHIFCEWALFPWRKQPCSYCGF